MRDVVHLDHRLGALARQKRFRVLMTVAVGEVQQAIGDSRRPAIWGHVIETHADQRLRLVADEAERNGWRAKDFDALGERFGDEHQRAPIILALVRRPFGITAITADFARRDANPQRRAKWTLIRQRMIFLACRRN